MMSSESATKQPLGRTFLAVWFGQVVSQFGSSMTGFAMSIVVFQENNSVTELAMVLLAANLPGIVLAPLPMSAVAIIGGADNRRNENGQHLHRDRVDPVWDRQPPNDGPDDHRSDEFGDAERFGWCLRRGLGHCASLLC